MRRIVPITAAGLTVAFLAAAWLAATAGPAADRPSEKLGELRSIADSAAARGLTPGMAIAVVQGDRLLWQTALGVADLESGRPVREDTRFYLSSTSKALTGLAAACLAGRGALDLDAPLSRALPGIQLPAGLSADSIRVVDLLTHTHGIDGVGPVSLRRGFTGEYTNADLLAALATHRASSGGRAFQYSNVGYDLLGIVLDPARPDGWKSVVEREVTEPLGMSHTTAWRSRLADAVVAMPHEMGPSGFERVRLAKEDSNMGPAGGHFSTAGDLARLLIAEMNGGRLDGRQVIASDVIASTWRIRVPQDRAFGPFHRHGWGLCWDVGTHGRDTLVHRFGGFRGYRSHVSFMPARRLGVVVLVNGGDVSSSLSDVVAAAIYDCLLGRTVSDTLGARLARLAASASDTRRAVAEDRAKRAARRQPPAFPVGAYVGAFFDPAYGSFVVENHNGGLEGRMGVARSPLEVFDASKGQFRTELFGFPIVVTAIADSAAARVDGYTFMNARLMRR